MSQQQPITDAGKRIPDALLKIEETMHCVLETYSNVHRGSGLKSAITSAIYDKARDLALQYMKLSRTKYRLVFCSHYKASRLSAIAGHANCQIVSSADFGLNLGICAFAYRKGSLPVKQPPFPGGGSARLISESRVIWAKEPECFEAGTPAVVNAIALVKAMGMATEGISGKFFKPIITDNVADILSPGMDETLTGQAALSAIRSKRIGAGITVPYAAGNRPYINLDNAASTPTFDPVWNAVRKCLVLSGPVKDQIPREVRKIIADFLHFSLTEYDVIFTQNTTEAVNILSQNLTQFTHKCFITGSRLEHSSNDLPWRLLSKEPIIRLDFDESGKLCPDHLDQLLAARAAEKTQADSLIPLVAITAASNVMGTYQDMESICSVVHKHGGRVFADGAQVVAHRLTDIGSIGIDAFVFSAHKVYAPFGCGVLVIKKGLLSIPEGETEGITTSGENNIAGIAALGVALRILSKIGIETIEAEENHVCSTLLQGLSGINSVSIHGISASGPGDLKMRSGVVSFSVKGKFPHVLAKRTALAGGLGLRFGCHCAHMLVKKLAGVTPGIEKFQNFLTTIIPGLNFPGVLRASIGLENTDEDARHFIEALKLVLAGSQNKLKTINGENLPVLNKPLLKALRHKTATLVNASVSKVFGSI